MEGKGFKNVKNGSRGPTCFNMFETHFDSQVSHSRKQKAIFKLRHKKILKFSCWKYNAHGHLYEPQYSKVDLKHTAAAAAEKPISEDEEPEPGGINACIV